MASERIRSHHVSLDRSKILAMVAVAKFKVQMEFIMKLAKYTKSPRTVDEIAAEMNVSTRTAYRCVIDLEELGFCFLKSRTRVQSTYQIVDINPEFQEKVSEFLDHFQSIDEPS